MSNIRDSIIKLLIWNVIVYCQQEVLIFYTFETGEQISALYMLSMSFIQVNVLLMKQGRREIVQP